MNKPEFDDWLAYHCAAFPGVSDWIRKNTPADATEEAKPAVHWRRALHDVEILDAKRATDAMLAGELEEPRGYSSHPRVIRRWCRDYAYGQRRQTTSIPTRAEGEEVYSCHQCQDSGTIPIVHPYTIQQVRRGVEFGEVRWYSCRVACECERGEKWRNALIKSNGEKRHAVAVFRDDIMFRIEGHLISAEEKERFWEWVESEPRQAVENHPNYRPEFA